MEIKDRIEKLLRRYLQEPDKNRIHHIEIGIPEHEGRFWIVDASFLEPTKPPSSLKLAVYFSVNQHTRKGKQLVKTIDILDLFEEYIKGDNRHYLSYYKVTQNNPSAIAMEIMKIITALFPTLDNRQIQAELALANG